MTRRELRDDMSEQELAQRIHAERSYIMAAQTELGRLSEIAEKQGRLNTHEDLEHAIGTLSEVLDTLQTRTLRPLS